MSQPCNISSCKYISRALCYCCKQDLCIDHLKEHHELLNAKLLPLADEINTLANQLILTNLSHLINDSHEKLEQWRLNSYKTIDRLFENKLQEIDKRFRIKIDQLRDEMNYIRLNLSNLIHQQEATYSDLNQLTLQIDNLKQKLSQIDQTSFQIDIHPLKIDTELIEIKQSLNLSTLASPSIQTVSYQNEYSTEFASNEQYLLIAKDSFLCLINQEINTVKQTDWTHDSIRNICWSSSLVCFILITSTGYVFSLNPTSMSIEPLITIPKDLWWSCTCSETSLYLSIDERGSPIIEFSLLPSIEYNKKWESPDTCLVEEFIYDICYNNETIVLMIANGLDEMIRMDLKSTKTFNRLWSLQLDIDFRYHAFRCCLLNCNEWLVIDWSGSRFIHITKDIKVKAIQMYKEKPWRACLFGTNMLVISAKNTIDFHLLTSNE